MLKKWLSVVMAVVLLGLSLPRVTNAEDQSNIKPVPAIFVHGFNDDASSWRDNEFYKWLGNTYTMTYAVPYGDIRGNQDKDFSYNDVSAPSVQSGLVETLKLIPKGQQVDIVVHSMGGLLVRSFLNDHANDEELLKRIRRVIFLQTPNHGSQVAFSGRLIDMIENKNMYFDFSNQDINDKYNQYKELYREYATQFQKWKGKRESYEEWLVNEKKSTVFQDMIDDSKKSAGGNLNIGAKPEAGGKPYRYSKGFEDYALLMLARYEVRKEKLGFYQIHDDQYKPYPDNTTINNGVNVFSRDVKDIAIDRLMLEQFYIFTQAGKDGRKDYATITANPFLDELNNQEAAYRKKLMDQGKYVPQYVTVATKLDKTNQPVFGYFDVGVWGKTQKEKDNDLVVPVSNVALPESLVNRNIILEEPAAHTTKMKWVGIRDMTEIMKRIFFNPLTVRGDKEITMTLDPKQPASFTSNEMVVKINSLLDQPNQEYELKISSNESDHYRIYALKRDKNQMWSQIEQVPLSFKPSGSTGTYSIKADPSVSDIVLVSIRDDQYANDKAAYERSGAFTVSYSPTVKTDSPSPPVGTSFNKDYYIEPVNYKTEKQDGWVTHKFRVYDSKTGKTVGNLNYSDFVLQDNTHSFASEPAWFFINKGNIRSGDNVALDLDYSGSMQGWPILQSEKSAEDFIINIKEDVNVAVIGFASETKVLSPFTTDYAKASRSVYTDRISGDTALYDSVSEAIKALATQKGNRTLLVMTDGMNNRGSTTIDKAIEEAKDHSVRIYAVGLGKEVDRQSLEKLTSSTGGQVFYTYEPGNLANIYHRVSVDNDYVYEVTYKNNTMAFDRTFDVSMTGGRSNKVSVNYEHFDPKSINPFMRLKQNLMLQ